MNSNWNAIKIMYFGLLGGSIFYLAVVFAMSKSLDLNFQMDEFTANILNTIGIVLGFGAYFGVKQLETFQLKKLDVNLPVADKLNWYRSTLIMEMGVLEGVSFIVITFFLMTSSYLSVTGLILTIPYMILLRPDIFKVAELIKSSKEEIEQVPNVVR